MKQKHKILFFFLLIVATLFLFTFPKTQKDMSPPSPALESFENTIPGDISVYDFMDRLRREGKIIFTEKNYAGMGKFIETINGVRGDGERNWIFYVNGVKAQVGVSDYKINKGDVVSWKYEALDY